MNMRRIALSVSALAVAGALTGLFLLAPAQATHGAGAPRSADAASAHPALAVRLVAPESMAWPRVIEASGGLYAWQEGVIAAETGGLRVVDVAVEVGDRVQRGQELARLDQETVQAGLKEQEARVAQAQAALSEAQANGERARTVKGKDKGAMSEQQINQYLIAEQSAKANLAAAAAALETQRIRLAQTRVLAVDDGVVSARSATLGMVAQTGTELFRIVRQGRIEWRAEVTAAQLAQIEPGQTAQIRLPGGETVVGKVRIPAPTLDANTRYALVYVDVPAASPARPGMFARGTIRIGESPALTLPESAVVLRDGQSFVYELLEGDRVAQRKVETGRRAGERVEIRDGLAPAARVVASGGAFLNDGDLVRVEPDASPAVAGGS